MPFETPQNGGFLVAAYVVAAVIYLAYAASLWGRAHRALREAGSSPREAGKRGSGDVRP
jgi:ABC-type branched-subunit amino acid transport system permease subunit